MTSVIGRQMIAGRSVSPMAIGCWSWGDSRQWGYEQAKDLQGIKDAWQKSIEKGITFYDTAEIYGKGESERILGKLIAEATPEVRKDLYIATKYLGIPAAGHFFLFRPAILTAIDLSLKRLGVDSIDLYMIHGPLTMHSFESMAKQLVTAFKAGTIKAVGVSNFSKNELIQMHDILARDDIPLAVNQVEFSILRQLPEKSGLLEEMKKRNVTCLGYSPLAMGRLTGKYSAANPPPKGRKFGGSLTWEEMDPLLTEMRSLAEKYDVPMSAIALNWVICKGAIPLGGARNADQAEQVSKQNVHANKENAKALTFRMTDAEVDSLSAKGATGTTGWWQHG